MSNPATGPRFRLAPGVVLRGGRRPPLPATAEAPGGFRNTRWDRAALAVSIDPVWLLAPLYARDAAGLTPSADGPGPVDPAIPRVTVTPADVADPAAAEWPAWWAAALAYRPGTPAPRPADLIAESPALQQLWTDLADGFRGWLAARPTREPGADAPARAVERGVLARYAATNGSEPGRWTVRILEIPVTGSYLHSPEPRRIVVSAALRADPDRYRAALTGELPRHF